MADLNAGRWHLVGDGIVLGGDDDAVDVRFDCLGRRTGSPDTALVTFSHRFQRRADARFRAVPFAADAQGAAFMVQSGDRLVLRITPTSGNPGVRFVPNGDGAITGGAIPRIDLPR